MKGLFDITMESIDPQIGDSFVPQAKALLEQIQFKVLNSEKLKVDNSGFYTDPIILDLANLIQKRFGINVAFVYSDSNVFAALPPVTISKNVLDTNDRLLKAAQKNKHDVLVEAFNELSKSIKNNKLSVDLSKAYIAGIGNVRSLMFFNFPFGFNKAKLTTDEMLAILLHELGHVFTFVEFMDRNHRYNMVLVDIAKRSLDGEDPRKYTYKISNISDSKELNKAIKDISKKDKVVWTISMSKAIIDDCLGLFDNYFYVDSYRESLADQFAARFGLDKELVMVLDKLNNIATNKVAKGLTVWYFIYLVFSFMLRAIIILVSILLNPMMTMVLIGVASIYIMAFILKLLGNLIVFGAGIGSKPSHKEIINRYKDIRNFAIENLKLLEGKLTKNQIQSILTSIEQIDKVIDKTDSMPFITTITENITRGNRLAKATRELERVLNDTVNNPFYVQYHKLRLAEQE